MASKYYVTLTTYGSDLIAQAHESTPLNFKNLVIGDANGIPYEPLTAIDRTQLVNQKASALVQHIEVIEDIVRVTATIGANIGGFHIHEIGLTDITDKLVYIGNYHGGYKSIFEEGAGGEITISIDIKGAAANNINMSVDSNINSATKAWVSEKFIPRDDIVNNLTTNDPAKPVSAAQAKTLQDNKLDKTANAVSATKLKTSRTIQFTGSVFGEFYFDGTTDIACELSSEDLDVVLYSPIPYSKTIAPTGYLIMMGQIIVEAQHPKLYARYGGTLPDMRGEFIRGFDTGRGIDENRAILSNQNATAVGLYVGGIPDSTLISFVDLRNPDSEYTDVSDGYRRYTSSGDKGTVRQILKSVRPRNISYNYIVKAG